MRSNYVLTPQQIIHYSLIFLMESKQAKKADLEKYDTVKVVNGYTIKNKLLGEGSSAKTYLSLKKDSIFACKMIIKSNLDRRIVESSSDEKEQVNTRNYILKSLQKEISNWKELNHPNIVKFIDYAETQNNLYFFLEYCDSNDLASIIKKKGGLPYKEGLKFLFDIAKGIVYLYEKGVYHRDLKPENILIHKNTAKIADFGFSKIMAESETKNKPQQQTVVGTPNYMAVQVLEGSDYSIKCDIWSIGVMAYKMFYGILPWGQVKDLAHLKKVVRKPISFPQRNDIPAGIPYMIQRMIVVQEQKRLNAQEVFDLTQKLVEQVQGGVTEMQLEE